MDLLNTELNLLFAISSIAWGLIFLYLYYTNNKLKKLEKEILSLTDE